MLTIIAAVEKGLAALKAGDAYAANPTYPDFKTMTDIMGMSEWMKIEDRFEVA
jgi:hypothetical protein